MEQAGGGGGYYGGSASYNDEGAGGGGSGYVMTSVLTGAGWRYTGPSSVLSGAQSFRDPLNTSTNIIGNRGNGFVRITKK